MASTLSPIWRSAHRISWGNLLCVPLPSSTVRARNSLTPWALSGPTQQSHRTYSLTTDRPILFSGIVIHSAEGICFSLPLPPPLPQGGRGRRTYEERYWRARGLPYQPPAAPRPPLPAVAGGARGMVTST